MRMHFYMVIEEDNNIYVSNKLNKTKYQIIKIEWHKIIFVFGRSRRTLRMHLWMMVIRRCLLYTAFLIDSVLCRESLS